MLISELIEKLQEIQNVEGDLEVKYKNNGFMDEIYFVEFNDKLESVPFVRIL